MYTTSNTLRLNISCLHQRFVSRLQETYHNVNHHNYDFGNRLSLSSSTSPLLHWQRNHSILLSSCSSTRNNGHRSVLLNVSPKSSLSNMENRLPRNFFLPIRNFHNTGSPIFQGATFQHPRGRPSISDEVLNHWAQFNATPLTLGEMKDFGVDPDLSTAIESTKFLQNELPVRLSQMAKDLERLPNNVFQTDAVQLVHSWYLHSLSEVLSTRKYNLDSKTDMQQFADMMVGILTRHLPVVTTLTRGIMEVKEEIGASHVPLRISKFLDRFHMSRVAIRMLISQHVELWRDITRDGNKDEHPTWVGVIDRECNPLAIAHDAAANARSMCMQNYAICPNIDIIEANGPILFSYVPSHLYHIFFELLKNSLRATVEHHGLDDADKHPTVRIIMSRGEHDVSIKIADEGGGIARANMPRVFDYLFTTAPTPNLDNISGMNHAPMAGLGYGLPLSRVYANYFGGDLQLTSMEGYGTDAYVYLNFAAQEQKEQLPSYYHIQAPADVSQVRDWTG